MLYRTLMPKRALFLVISGLLLLGCGASPSVHDAKARAELSGDSPLVAMFRDAERESGVPAELLATIAYVQTRLGRNQNPEPWGTDANAHMPREWGLMAIGSANLTSVDVAATLTGATPEKVATEARANVRGAAALLGTMGRARGATAEAPLQAWLAAVEAYGGEALRLEVAEMQRSGFVGQDPDGFEVRVTGIGGDDELGTVQLGLGYPGALWSPAYSGNYTNANRGAAQINYIVIHTTQGSYAGTISWFKNSSSKVSAHYVVRSSDGQITQMVDDRDIAWHDACFNTNSIGIEHEGYVADPGKWYTDAMYKASAKLTAWLSDQYGIPKDKAHIMGHGEAPDCSDHTDPGSGWNWSYYMSLVKNGGCAPKTEVCNGKDDDCDGKVDEGGVCNAKPTGYLDAVDCDSVRGWAQDPDAKTKSIDVHLYWGGPAGSGAKGTAFSADLSRPDLCSALGSCEHAFDVSPPLSLFDGKPHEVHGYAIDSAGGTNAELNKSPGTLNCTATVPEGVRRHVVNPDSLAAWHFDLFWQMLPLTDTQIAGIPEADALPAAPELVQADDGSPEVWLVDGKWRRHVPDPAAMAAWGFAFSDVKQVPAAEVDALKLGPDLRPEPVLVKDSTGKVDAIDDPMPAEPGTGGSGANGGSGGSGASSSTGGATSSGGSSGGQKTKLLDDGNSDGSCACRAAGGSTPPTPGWLALALLALPWMRRRKGSARRLLLLAPALFVLGCSAPPQDADEGDPLDDDPALVSTSSEPLSSIDCSESQDTGYTSGNAFPITVVTVDGKKVEEDTANAYYVMAQAAAASGVTLKIVSGFRTMAEQQYLYNCYVNCSCNNCNLAAKPGYSNHQSGHALDLNTSSGGVLTWLNNNGAAFGFKRTVPSETWHWEWWGGGPGGGPCGNQKPTGYLDGVDCDSVHGWAQDPDAKTKSIDVHLYWGGPAGSGAKGAAFSADLSRPDLCSALGSCEHAFDVSPPLSLFDGKPHEVHGYAIDSAGGTNAELNKSPGTLNCTATVPEGVRRHVVNPDSLAAWHFDLFWQMLPLTDTQIAGIPEADALPAAPELVQADDGSPEVWLVDGKWRRHVPDPAAMAAWGFAFSDVKQVPAAEVDALKLGPDLRPEPVLVKDSTGKVDAIDDPMPAEPGTGGSDATGGSGGTPSSSGGASSGGASSGGSSGGQKTKLVDDGSDEGSCACRQAGGSGPNAPGWLALLVVAVPVLRRRRCA